MMHAGDELVATDARHAVVERHAADAFVPNDVTLDGAAHQLVILTGPNMGGKSTYLRQTALLCLMAQAGSFVPARTAKLPVVDRLFARVGASDNIARGQSTFMVEMQETANILHCATSRSLVILDEIGRGTSTFDGLSLAWAVAEHLASNSRARPKTIFATHYHELTDLADALPAVANFHVVVREWKDDIVFLRKVVPGRSDRSYGIQVARLAGLPPAVVGARARDPERTRTRRAVARRPSVAQRRRRSDRQRSSACSRRRRPPTIRVHRRLRGARRQRHHADAGAGTARGTEGRGRRMNRRPRVARLLRRAHCRLVARVGAAASRRPTRTGSSSRWPTPAINLDPRVGTDDASQKLHQLLFSTLVRIDEQLRVVPDLAESLDQPDPSTFVAHLRRGVLFHNGRELTSDDVVYTFRSFLDPAFRGRSGRLPSAGRRHCDAIGTPSSSS